MNYQGAVFFDYDGTLADESRKIFLPTKTTRETIKKLKEKGYIIFLSTGRSKCYIPQIGDLFDGYVAANGAYCELFGKEIHSAEFDECTVSRLINVMESKGFTYSFENQKFLFVNDVKSKAYIDMLNTFNISPEIMRPIEERQNVCKGIVLFDSDDDLISLQKSFEGEIVFDRHRTYNSADVTAFGVNKSTGVRNVIEKLGIPLENTYAFGDGTNDVEMLKAVGFGVAMGESAPQAIEAASYVTDTVINEGITKAFEHFKII